jgi:hypothetical protein
MTGGIAGTSSWAMRGAREKNGRSEGADRPWEVPGLPGSSRTAVQPQGYTGLAIVAIIR